MRLVHALVTVCPRQPSGTSLLSIWSQMSLHITHARLECVVRNLLCKGLPLASHPVPIPTFKVGMKTKTGYKAPSSYFHSEFQSWNENCDWVRGAKFICIFILSFRVVIKTVTGYEVPTSYFHSDFQSLSVNWDWV